VTSEPVRSVFGPASRHLGSGLGLLAGGVASTAVIVWLLLSPPAGLRGLMHDRGLAALALVLALWLIGTAAMMVIGSVRLWHWLPMYRITFDAEGIEVVRRRRRLRIPWRDVRSWRVGKPSRLTPGRDALLVEPADHVTDPGDVPWWLFWRPGLRRWIVCEPELTDGGATEIAAAMRRFVPDRETGPPAAVVFTRSRNRLRLAVMNGALGLFFMLFGVIVVLMMKSVFEDLPATVWLGLIVPLLPASFCGFSAAYLARLWLADPTLSVDPTGVRVCWRGETVHLPWHVIGSWRLIRYWPAGLLMGKQMDQILGDRILVAVPASDLADPASGARRLLWSSRWGGWVLARPGQFAVPPQQIEWALGGHGQRIRPIDQHLPPRRQAR
jgi:hypothetical protein